MSLSERHSSLWKKKLVKGSWKGKSMIKKASLTCGGGLTGVTPGPAQQWPIAMLMFCSSHSTAIDSFFWFSAVLQNHMYSTSCKYCAFRNNTLLHSIHNGHKTDRWLLTSYTHNTINIFSELYEVLEKRMGLFTLPLIHNQHKPVYKSQNRTVWMVEDQSFSRP